MVNFIDLIKDIKGKKALNASNQADLEAYNKLVAGEDIDVQPTQQVVQQPVKQDTLLMGPDGKVDYNASVRLKQQTTPLSLADRLIGREVHIDKETIDPKTNEMTTQRFSDYKPGFLNDFSAGYKENAATPISFNNFGQNKNPATRLGEGFGTAARLLDNPLMRGVIAYGLSNSMGDRRPLIQALNATVGTQQNRMKDATYRKQLQDMGFDTSSIRGYITDDVYKNIVAMKQLEDNAAYRNTLLKIQQKNQELDNQLAQQKFAYQKGQDAIQNAQRWAEISAKNAENSKGGEYEKPKIILANVLKAWEKMPQSTAWQGTSKGKAIQTGVGNLLGMRNNNVTQYMALKESMVTPLARAISQEKGATSDKDIARARAMLPSEFDSYQQGMARFNAISSLLDDLERGVVSPNNAEQYIQNYMGNSGSNTQTMQNGTTQVGKYKVRVK